MPGPSARVLASDHALDGAVNLISSFSPPECRFLGGRWVPAPPARPRATTLVGADGAWFATDVGGHQARGRSDLWLFARTEWRGRWRSYLVLTVLVAATVGTVLAAVLAASRSTTAFDRLRAATHASDAAVSPPDDLSPSDRMEAALQLEGVYDARAEAELFVRPEGSDLIPNYTLLALAPLADDGPDAVNTPVVSEGRAPDPTEPLEVALSEQLAADLGVRPGDRLALESMTFEWVEEAYRGGDPGPPDGPRMEVTVTGLARTPAEFGQRPNVIHLTPAFAAEYGDDMRAYQQIHVRIAPEVIARVEAGDASAFEGVEVDPSPFYDSATTEDGLSTIARSLRLFAAVAALAGGIVIGLALSRMTRAGLRYRRALAAMGWTRRHHALAVTLAFVPWVIAGVGLGLLAGVAASPRAMLGLASAVDPEPHVIIAGTPLVIVGASGALLGSVLVLLVVVWWTVGGRGGTDGPSRARGTPLARPLPASLAVRHAMFGTAEQGVRASRASLTAMVLGVAAAIAALVVSASIGLLQTDPRLTGAGSERSIDSGESLEVYERAMPALTEDDRVDMLAGLHILFGGSADGVSDMPVLAYDVRRGEVDASVVTGELPTQPDEVALGPETLEATGAEVGDSIAISVDDATEEFRVVGAILFPEGDFEHDEGFAMTVGGGDRLVDDTVSASQIHMVVFDWADGVDEEAADRSLLEDELRVQTTQTELQPPTVTNLAQVEVLPRYLALFVALLSLTTLAHATWIGVRLRARELATLQALGMTHRSTAAVVWCQALVLVVVALVLAVPIGIAVGRQIWRPIAEDAHVVVRPDVPWPWVIASVAAVLAVGVGLAALSGVRALRLRPAVQLRAE
jgi:hypothetical protein